MLEEKTRGGGLEITTDDVENREILDPDNPENEKVARFCPTKGSNVLNPIIDWSDEEVWEFIRDYKIPYCKLYDEGYQRIGCIGCPMGSNQAKELERNPKYKQAYIRAFDRMLKGRIERGLKSDNWKNGEEVMEWWLNSKGSVKKYEQEIMLDIDEKYREE